MYAEEDIARLRLARLATELGHPISRLAAMSTEQLSAMVGRAAEASSAAEMQPMVARLLDAVARYRCDECDEVLGLAATLLSMQRLVHGLLVPVLHEVGDRCIRGGFSVAQERLLGACVGRTVQSLIANMRRRQAGPVVVLCTPQGERHELGLMLSALLLAEQGLDCIYLGSEVPFHDIALAANATAARCVGLSLVLTPPPDSVHSDLQDLVEELPCGCSVWLGGTGAEHLDQRRLPPQCSVIANDGALTHAVHTLLSDPTPVASRSSLR